MTSPDGQCWRGTLNNSGVLGIFTGDMPLMIYDLRFEFGILDLRF